MHHTVSRRKPSTRRMKIVFAIFIALVLALAVVTYSASNETAYAAYMPPGDLTGKLVILHTNDTHGGDVAVAGQSIGTAGVAQLVADYEAAGAKVLLVSAGDATQGDPLVNLSKGETAIEFMNLAGYDMMVPGNHEFDFGYDNLLSLEELADFPFVSATILDRATEEPIFEENIVYDTDVGKVGVFGLTTPETQTKANPLNVASLTFLAGEELYDCAQEQVDELEALGCEYIVCVTHLGDDPASEPNRSVDVIENVEGIDIMIDGHSHSVLDGDENDDTILASAGTRLSHVGVVIVDEDDTESFLISAEEYSSVDETVNAYINGVAAEIDAMLSETFAVTEVLLDGERAPGVRTQETNLGDFAADAILWAATKAVGEGLVDAAVTNGGGIRTSIAAGDITMKDMKTVFPFGNTISTVRVTGTQLLELLEAATYCTPEAVGAFPQVAGLEFTINTYIPYTNGPQYPDSTYYAPANPGARITDVRVAGEPLDLTDSYTIATNDFLAAGGDTYYLLKTLESYNTYVALEDALVNYTSEVLGGIVTEDRYGQPAGRITIASSGSLPFTDVATDASYYEAVGYVYWNGLFRGVSDTEFAPNRKMSRAMFATVLYRLEGEPEASGQSFPDVVGGSYYEKAAIWAAANEIFVGNGTGFNPNSDMTRQGVAAVLYRYAVYKGYDPSELSGVELAYPDSDSILAWAVEGAKYCQLKGIIQGRDNGAFAPYDGATRAQVATMLMRFATLE
jgi:5'-nucleotidase/UDP-sugar diphosphatase